jgi:hypothetical protein
VAIEQAIGILAERTGEAPRLAFESLRQVARSRGQRVHELARKVVSSVTDSSIILPTGLPQSRRGTIPRPNESPQHDEPDATLV